MPAVPLLSLAGRLGLGTQRFISASLGAVGRGGVGREAKREVMEISAGCRRDGEADCSVEVFD